MLVEARRTSSVVGASDLSILRFSTDKRESSILRMASRMAAGDSRKRASMMPGGAIRCAVAPG
jgi:hypothetical protein